MRLIDADAFKTQVAAVTALKGLNVEKAALLLMLIDQQPTVDAAPVVNAEWILHQEIGFGEADKECSACGTMSLISSHRCHRCGARMDAPERE